MNTKLYAITAATGQIGSQIAKSLLAQGHRVRALSRDAAKLQALVALGAEAQVGASDDVAYLTEAFRGVDAVFALIPPNYGAADYRAAQNVVGKAQADAIAKSGVRKVVNLSSTGAHLHGGATGPIRGLSDQEARLGALAIDVVNLRPTYFMENLAFTLDPIKHMNIVGTPLAPTTRLPMIATKDIAAKAVELLTKLDFRGQSAVEILGERDLTMPEVTEILAKASGRATLTYVQFPYADAEQAMIGAGLSPDTAARMVEMYRSFNEGVLVGTQPRSAKATTPTRIEDFAEEFVKATAIGL